MTISFPLVVKMVMIDLDGTLIDTAPDIAAAANRMLEELGRPARDPAAIAAWIGNGVSRLVKRALTGEREAEPQAALFERAYPLFRKHYAELLTARSRPYPGVVEGLERLKAQGFALACITNKAEAFTAPLLKALGLDRYFELVLAGDSLARKKPDPLPLVHACRHFGITPDHGVLVGDSDNASRAARAAGMPVICVTYGYNRGEDVRSFQPDGVIDSLTELPNYLRLYR